MGFFDFLKIDPLKSTANWGAKCMKIAVKDDWENAHGRQREVFLSMLHYRPGTPPVVKHGVETGQINTLTELCASILLSEAVSVNPDDIPQIFSDIRNVLVSKGIPADFL